MPLQCKQSTCLTRIKPAWATQFSTMGLMAPGANQVNWASSYIKQHYHKRANRVNWVTSNFITINFIIIIIIIFIITIIIIINTVRIFSLTGGSGG
jgi:preprotein translocase subunit SecE